MLKQLAFYVIIVRSKVKTRRGMCLLPIVGDVTRKITQLKLPLSLCLKI